MVELIVIIIIAVILYIFFPKSSDSFIIAFRDLIDEIREKLNNRK